MRVDCIAIGLNIVRRTCRVADFVTESSNLMCVFFILKKKGFMFNTVRPIKLWNRKTTFIISYDFK